MSRVLSQPEFAFEDGELRIASASSEMRLRWGDDILAEERLMAGRGKWREFWPEFRILQRPADKGKAQKDDGADKGIERKRQAFAGFRKLIPKEFTTIVEQFPSHQWALLKQMHEQQTFRDLAGANRVLAFCLANAAEIRHMSPESAAVLAVPRSHMKQKEILKWLDFPDTTATVNLFRKIIPMAAMPYLMSGLRQTLISDSPTQKLLAHQKRIGAGVLALATSKAGIQYGTPKLLEEVASIPEEEEYHLTVDILENALLMLLKIRDERIVPKFRSIAKVQAFHDDVAGDYEAFVRERNELRAENKKKRESKSSFPEPPVPGTPIIVPITSEYGLRKEGKEQRNCVGAYASQVKNGSTYIYKVLAPERATLSIRHGSDGSWQISEFKAKANSRVKHLSVTLVKEWLYTYSLSA